MDTLPILRHPDSRLDQEITGNRQMAGIYCFTEWMEWG